MMKNLFTLIILLTYFSCQNTGTPSATSETAAEEEIAPPTSGQWKSLFDGSDTNHWKGYGQTAFPAKGWVVEGDELVIQKTPKPRPAGFGGDIITKEKFSDFELSLEFMVTDTANSGIFYFVVEEEGSAIWYNAPEYQILDDETYIKTGRVEANSAQLSGSNYDLQAAPPGLLKPVGEWNKVKILHKDGHVEHWLNGEKTVEYQVGSPEWTDLVEKSKFKDFKGYGRAKEGHIGLQDHDHEVRFRNIKIREF